MEGWQVIGVDAVVVTIHIPAPSRVTSRDSCETISFETDKMSQTLPIVVTITLTSSAIVIGSTKTTAPIVQGGAIGVRNEHRRPDMLLPLVERLVVLAVEIHPVSPVDHVGVGDGDPAPC